MAGTTALLLFKAALLELLEGADLGDEVEVSGNKEPERAAEYVWIWKTKAAPREFRAIGRQPAIVDEELRATLRVLVVKGDPDEAEARAMEIASAVEMAVRTADVQDVVDELMMPLLVESIEPEPVRFDQKAGFHVLMTVCCSKARSQT